MRTCSKCREQKAADAFYAKGLWCKECFAVKNKEWRACNAEKNRARVRAWRAANPDAVRRHAREGSRRHYAAGAARLKAWRVKNPARQSAINNRYFGSEKGRLASVVKRHRRRAAFSDTSPATITALMARAGGSCEYCGRTARLEVDHITSIYRGGTDTLPNLAAACKSCNSSKGPREVTGWMLRRFGHVRLPAGAVVRFIAR